MSGKNAGVSTKVLKVNPKAVYLHCYAHSLNLAVQDTTKQCTIIRDAMDITEITKLVKANPKREAWLEKLKIEQGTGSTISPKVQVFTNKASANIVQGLVPAENVYGITDILNKTLQTESLTASEARKHALSVVTMLTNVSKPVQPRRRKSPIRYDPNNGSGRELSIGDRYNGLFFEVIDHAIHKIKERFTLEGISKQITLETLVYKASNNQPYVEELEETLRFYGDDFQSDVLPCELEMLRLSNTPIKSASDFFVWIRRSCAMYLQLAMVARLLLLMPASNAAPERSFGAMNRVLTAIRASMGQKRLNNLLILHVHNDLTDKLDIQAIIDTFKHSHSGRSSLF
ncbi:uncharacterized protein [Watersipora subatra]|uniref:uncharacterized protein n=1 Tax=Watersipora subatra TaxID=2589382 RepID=UPI00355B4D68